MSHELQTPEPPTQRPRPARRVRPTPHHKSAAELIHEAEDEGFFGQHRVKLIVAGLLALVVGVALLPKSKPSAPVRQMERIVQVQLPPPPPPKVQPPPPKVQPPPDKMEKETQPTEAKKAEAPKKADAPPPTAMATGIKGTGPGVGLGSSGTGIGGGNAIGGTGTGGSTGSKWGWYAGQVQAKIADALRQHPKTKAAAISGLQVRIWPDATGRITRAALAGSTGNAAVDAAIEREILSGLQLTEPPPAGMKLPITLRLSAKRPN
jgi:periplasmic protein TonB